MTTVQDILTFMEGLAPYELAESWDNVGLLVDAGKPVDGVLTALDITPATVREARAVGCNAIVSHHPVIFRPLIWSYISVSSLRETMKALVFR